MAWALDWMSSVGDIHPEGKVKRGRKPLICQNKNVVQIENKAKSHMFYCVSFLV